MANKSYTVFARKYRPTTFDEIVGQGHIVRTLKNAITQNRVGHAHLFSGPRGVGKTTLARVFAKALNCVKGPTITPCGTCELCRSIQNGTDIDVIEIDAASNRRLEDVQDLRESLHYAPMRARTKIYILDEIHMLTTEAFNALLKTLEEPPSHVKFIFATTNAQKLPDTIRSRCQHFKFRPISARECVDRLGSIAEREGLKIPPPVMRGLALHAQGSLRDAESMLDQLVAFKQRDVTEEDLRALLGAAPEEWIFQLVDRIQESALDKVLRMTEEVYLQGVDPSMLLRQCTEHYRQLLHMKASGDPDAPEEILPTLRRQAEKLSPPAILYAIQILLESSRRLRDEADPRLVLELAFAKLALSADLPALADLIEKSHEAPRPEPRSRSAPPPAPLPPPPPPPAPKPTPPAAQKPAAPGGYAATDLGTITEHWTSVVGKIKQRNAFLGGVLGDARPISLDGDELTILLMTESNDYLLKQLDSPRNRSLIEKQFGDTVGRALRGRYAFAGAPGSPPASDPIDPPSVPIVKKVTDMFPGTRVVE